MRSLTEGLKKYQLNIKTLEKCMRKVKALDVPSHQEADKLYILVGLALVQRHFQMKHRDPALRPDLLKRCPVVDPQEICEN